MRGQIFLDFISLLAPYAGNVLSFPLVNPSVIPWDFALILAFLGLIIPWRGAVRMKSLLRKPELTTGDRLALYGSTIIFQWLIVAVVAWRCRARMLGFAELGLTTADPWRIVWSGIALTALLCVNQVFGLRKMASLPVGKRGSLFAITEKIMPRTSMELLVFAGLACTAGISEEFLYRGFVFGVLLRIFAKFAGANVIAVALSSVWFSATHWYQGRRGLITTCVVGIIFAVVRIWTRSLVPVMVAHAGIDLVAGIFVSRFLRRA